MTRVGLLHTVPALVDAFEQDVTAAIPGVETVHLVDAALLADAVALGVDDGLRARVATAVHALVAQGVDAVLATCSSIGEAVEQAGATASVPVLRVDAPMAAEAVRSAGATGAAGHVAVLATLSATLGPTGRLIERAVRDGGPDAAHVTVTSAVVDGAAAARAAGEPERSTAMIRAAVLDATRVADVVVLAQASMAAAVPDGLDVPVLTSPAGGVAALAAVVAPAGVAASSAADAPGGMGTLPGTLRA